MSYFEKLCTVINSAERKRQLLENELFSNSFLGARVSVQMVGKRSEPGALQHFAQRRQRTE